MTDELPGASITAKERLERIETMLTKMDEKIDAKFDSMGSRITTIEIGGSRTAIEAEREVVALEARVRNIETNIAPIATTVLEKAAKLEARVIDLETNVVPVARLAAKTVEDQKRALEGVQATLEGVKRRMWIAVGALGALSFVGNFGIQLGWFK
jgi:hypothetical protein